MMFWSGGGCGVRIVWWFIIFILSGFWWVFMLMRCVSVVMCCWLGLRLFGVKRMCWFCCKLFVVILRNV